MLRDNLRDDLAAAVLVFENDRLLDRSYLLHDPLLSFLRSAALQPQDLLINTTAIIFIPIGKKAIYSVPIDLIHPASTLNCADNFDYRRLKVITNRAKTVLLKIEITALI